MQQTLMPGNGVYNPALGLNSMDMTGTGWTDLDQLLGYSGNVDFPYFPGEVQPAPQYTPYTDTTTQWNDLFGNLANTNNWGSMTNGIVNGDGAGQTAAWHQGVQVNGQAQAEDQVNDFFHHVASALGG
jgi:hypothetical protein